MSGVILHECVGVCVVYINNMVSKSGMILDGCVRARMLTIGERARVCWVVKLVMVTIIIIKMSLFHLNFFLSH